jgi:bacteriorhodopsin
MEEQMKSASRISLIFSSAFFFLLSCWLMTHITEMNFGIVQRSTMGKRLDFCLTLCLYITFFSALFNAVQLMDDDNLLLRTVDGEETILDLGRIVEWMLTCPLMQLAVPVLAGEKVPDSRRTTMPIVAFTVLFLGLLSTLAENIAFKAILYAAGTVVFLGLLYLMNACVYESSNGGESLFYGTSFLRGLIVLVALTWIPFPIWYGLSPEGFNIIKDEPGMKVAVAFLNIFSKGSFIMYLTRIRADFQTRQKTMVSIGYIKSDGTLAKKGTEGFDQVDGKKQEPEEEPMHESTLMLLEDVLETMGRSKDKALVVDLLQSNLITTNEDVLALTKEYCRDANVPWGMVVALKSKIRANSVQLDDPWSMQDHAASPKPPASELSFSAPHIAKNKKKIESVKRRQLTAEGIDGSSDIASNNPRSSLSASESVPLSPMSTKTPLGLEPAGPFARDDDRLAEILEEHQTNVNTQVDECRQFVMHSMDKIMNVLEQRLTDANHAPAAHLNHPQAGHLNHPPLAQGSTA